MSFKFGEGKSDGSAMFKKFETSDEIEEKKRKRQEEWEKVRRPDQPLGVFIMRLLYCFSQFEQFDRGCIICP